MQLAQIIGTDATVTLLQIADSCTTAELCRSGFKPVRSSDSKNVYLWILLHFVNKFMIFNCFYGCPPAGGPPVILFLLPSFRSSFFLFRCLISEAAWSIITKLCHMFSGDPDLWNLVRNLGTPSARNLAAQKHEILAVSDNFVTYRKYLRNAMTHRQSENGAVPHSQT